MPLLSVLNLRTQFLSHDGWISAVDGVSFDIDAGRTLALVGESGCGKSATALSVMRLLDRRTGRVAGGEIVFEGRDLAAMDEAGLRGVRGRRFAMIFQEPMTSLNPVVCVGEQIAEALRLHRGMRAAAKAAVVELLAAVGIADAARRYGEFPHQMSGGMRQRVMTAMALCCRPALLIADEPTTALDVTVQAQILELLRRLQREHGMALLLITHDLDVAAQVADEIAVMYAGRIVERGPAAAVFADPKHPYTQALFRSTPRLAANSAAATGAAAQGGATGAATVGATVATRRRRLETIPGNVPDPRSLPDGCRFHPRCEIGRDDPVCHSAEQALEPIGDGCMAACWKVRIDLHAAAGRAARTQCTAS